MYLPVCVYVHVFTYILMCIYFSMYYVYFWSFYVCVYVYVCASVLLYACIFCIYVYIFFQSLSWFPLFLDTSSRRINVWCLQPLTYPITHRHRNIQNHIKTKEVTLQPTPPLECMYIAPSIMVLFPLNQCKSLFPKFKTNSIKTYTSKYNKNMIHNLSSHTLSRTNSQFSPKAYSLFPPQALTFKKQTNKCWNKFKTRTLTQYFFRNDIHDKPFPLLQQFKGKSKWTPPASDKPTFINFFTRIEQDLIPIKTHLVKTCNKSGAICIMKTRCYLNKIHTYLQDLNTYKSLACNPASAIVNDKCTIK